MAMSEMGVCLSSSSKILMVYVFLSQHSLQRWNKATMKWQDKKETGRKAIDLTLIALLSYGIVFNSLIHI